MNLKLSTSLLTLPLSVAMYAQTPCGATLAGVVVDGSNARLPHALLSVDATEHTTVSADGTFRVPCLREGPHFLAVSAEGFATKSLDFVLPHEGSIAVVLVPPTVETTVNVDAAQSAAPLGAATKTLTGRRLDGLAEDPDELLRQLNQMAAAGGASIGNVIITVDGFQDATALPPKSDIASITVDPDLYSAEYAQPPYNGARIEVHTKPGQKALHGSLFAVNGSPFEDAKDPFSTSTASVGKQRYGGTLTGPFVRGKSDFRLGIEERSISDYSVVNAVTLSGSGQPQATNQTVETPQQLLLPSAGVSWQTSDRNLLTMSYTGSDNHLNNVGVGGLTLAGSGYTSDTFDHVLRFSDEAILSSRVVNEARASLRFTGENDKASSSVPQVQVAGAFTGGGSSLGNQRIHEKKLELDDTVLLAISRHTLKLGNQLLINRENRGLTTDFNGAYVFGGGSAPVQDSSGNIISGQTEEITALEQYCRTLARLPGGSPTSFNLVYGSPTVQFTQLTNALFIQDEWSVAKSLHLSAGLRYFTQTAPSIAGALTPRLGVNWSPDSMSRWSLHAHAGMFATGFSPAQYAEVLRLDGEQRKSSLVYDPVFGDPISNAIPITTTSELAPHFSYTGYTDENVGGSTVLPFGWQLDGDLSFGRIRNGYRSLNINSPLDGSSYGRRPGPPNSNVMQEQNSGKGRIDIELLSFSQPNWKRAQVSFGSVRIHQSDDLETPESSYSGVGEFARATGLPVWQAFGNLDTRLPGAIHVNADFHENGGIPYNVTTGADNNGDGIFNDRPVFSSFSQPNSIDTPWGPVLNGGVGIPLPRNRGTVPTNIHLDLSLERTFALKQNVDRNQNLVVSLRSSNLLNHTNITAIGSTPGSPLFGEPYAASSARRVEAEALYTF